MADIDHQETLDFLDKVSVCLYRAGISLFAVSLVGFSLLTWFSDLDSHYRSVLVFIGIAAAFSAANIHVYSKTVRLAISWSSWIGLVLMLSDHDLSRVWLSLGFVFVTFSGIALKESYCFKVPGLKLVPLLLFVVTFVLCFDHLFIASVGMLLAGLIMGYLSIAKWRMPLHFDIGNKAKYEV
ncbi:DUF2301 domain-containing membrane protein [Vibrio sp. J1-1]|uniref:DUF2301 domain-containing membrane protein n=1 Tax=Vibrio sp. J1-1 TaxID=2912251 RepID=UPI001F3B7E78|nr:DUF2301 domain-containing membrane protein [Vibrio sp. J1-1]MCF7481002.1 DUF2301 domain-containing membrane protein [Vibrio sp. J1-1]